MTQNQAIETLKLKAATIPAVGAVLLQWSTRDRARNQVTLRALSQKMKREGYKHEPAEYALALKAMSEAGFGTLETDAKGKVKALKNIKVKLQSVGQSVLGTDGSLKPFRPRNRFQTLNTKPVEATTAPKPPAQVVLKRRATDKIKVQKSPPVSILVIINGKDVVIPIPANMTAEDVGALVRNFQLK